MTTAICAPANTRTILAEMIGRECRIAPEQVDFDKSFSEYGFDSFAALTVSGELEDRLGVELPTTLLWDCPTPAALLAFVQENFASLGGDAFA